MNNLEFQKEMKRLVNRYGSKAFTEELINLIFHEVRHLSAGEFSRVVTLIEGEFPSRSPKISEIKELCRIERNKQMYSTPRLESRDGESMFNAAQKQFLWAFTKRVASRTIKNQNEVLKLFLPLLDQCIQLKDLETLNALFKEVGEANGIPYEVR